MDKIPLLCITGPTASGKTSLAVEVARLLDGEVVSCDSMQVYEGMPIATAQPTEEEKCGIPHHLIGCVSPTIPMSAMRYAGMARVAIADIAGRGKLPILCGGTGLYINAVVDGLTYAPAPPNPALRDNLAQRLENGEANALIEEIRATDSQTADRLSANDHKRIIRALELISMGTTVSAQNAASQPKEKPYRTLFCYLFPQRRDTLYRNINARVGHMLANGLIEEATRTAEISAIAPTAAQAIGHKELIPWLHGKESLETCLEKLKQATRNYAKRQLSWLRSDLRRREEENNPLVKPFVLYMEDEGNAQRTARQADAQGLI
ncbi:MAG: tRNA (adenosine(37)-N6)-dimethylallyltransferase MiaA [Oscillospiraceae bacterium]|nr:tRNA (adenosine(37)-N6)-dimethylallyltransferase MiaA [Oscillospiraceae bacterium]